MNEPTSLTERLEGRARYKILHTYITLEVFHKEEKLIGDELSVEIVSIRMKNSKDVYTCNLRLLKIFCLYVSIPVNT